MIQTYRTLCLVLAAILVPGTLMALPWDEDMRNAPSIKPQEAQVYSNTTSVPTMDDEPYSVPADKAELVRTRLIAGQELTNPVIRSAESVDRGKALYEIHCWACHGSEGAGDGPVGQKYRPTPMDLKTKYVQQQPDGQLFYTITHGGVVMPIYRESIDINDRWHLVNYVKNVLGQGTE